jgi:hypothetical protein
LLADPLGAPNDTHSTGRLPGESSCLVGATAEALTPLAAASQSCAETVVVAAVHRCSWAASGTAGLIRRTSRIFGLMCK